MPGDKRKTPRPSYHGKPQPTRRLESLRPTYFFAPDLEREIGRLEGVTAARVLTSGSDIDEIHIVAGRTPSPKKLVRNIETLLLIRFGIRIDHRRVSIVQTDQLQTAYPGSSRPHIVSVHRSDLRPAADVEGARIQVELSMAEEMVTGVGYERDGESELYACCRAVIHGVEQLLNTSGVLTVEGVEVRTIHEQAVVLVLLRWLFAGEQERLVGATLAEDLLEATARATLDALNRKLIRIQTNPPTVS